MSVSTQENYEAYPKATEAELEKIRQIRVEAKKRSLANPPKTAQEAWAKFDEVRNKIREFVNNSDR